MKPILLITNNTIFGALVQAALGDEVWLYNPAQSMASIQTLLQEGKLAANPSLDFLLAQNNPRAAHVLLMQLMDEASLLLFDAAAYPSDEWRELVNSVPKYPLRPLVWLVDETELQAITPYLQALNADFITKPVSSVVLRQRVSQLRSLLAHLEQVGNETILRFLNQASVYLNSRINDVLGHSQVLLEEHDGRLNAQQMDDVVQVHGSAWDLHDYVERLADVALMDSQRLRLNMQTLSMHTIVQEAVNIIQERHSNKMRQLMVTLPPTLPLVPGDYDRLVQVVVCALDNAYRFTNANGLIVVAAALVNGVLHVTIQDDGSGISDMEHVFDKWDGSLRLARYLIEQHQGKFWLESERGKGTTVRFTLATD